MSEPSNIQEPPAGGSDQRLVRRLIIDFFKLGTLARCEICFLGGWLSREDTETVEGQALWALAFTRAQERGEFGKLRNMIDANTPNGEFSGGGALL